MTDAETFTRLYYYGRVQMGMGENEFWLMPIGLFLDLWACHKQFLGLEKAVREQTIDDIIGAGI
ncbi:MAG: hypothetical protein FWH26_01895 [Oscillospiraceae bacterium]|nr:hypothetical protein [Oscillospiraceae bacterium]